MYRLYFIIKLLLRKNNNKMFYSVKLDLSFTYYYASIWTIRSGLVVRKISRSEPTLGVGTFIFYNYKKFTYKGMTTF